METMVSKMVSKQVSMETKYPKRWYPNGIHGYQELVTKAMVTKLVTKETKIVPKLTKIKERNHHEEHQRHVPRRGRSEAIP
jgi:hypothetical protein